jgi:hypothetical protein
VNKLDPDEKLSEDVTQRERRRKSVKKKVRNMETRWKVSCLTSILSIKSRRTGEGKYKETMTKNFPTLKKTEVSCLKAKQE